MSADHVWAVVTAYEPAPALLELIAALKDQVEQVIVVDDGSTRVDALEVLRRAADVGARVLDGAGNRGIAAALNNGITTARDAGADAVVTFDQDSTVSPGFVAALVSTRDAAARAGRAPAPIVPEYFAGVRQGAAVGKDGVLLARHAIQSGMLIEGALLDHVGLLREDLFIDLVDTEFDLRCARHARPAIAAPGLRLEHSLGKQYRRTFLGRPIRLPGLPPVITLSTPFRYYYRVRNRVVVTREYARAFPARIARETVADMLHFMDAVISARPRRALWRVYRDALRDARRDRLGAMPPAARERAATVRWADPAVASPEPARTAAELTVSVCMATYNGERHIAHQLASILDQLRPEDEVVIVDDASTDATVEAVRAVGDERIRLITQPHNRGYVRTFEAALSAASGDVLMLADQDDEWVPGRRDALAEAAARSGFAAGNVVLLGDDRPLPSPLTGTSWVLSSLTHGGSLGNELRLLAGNAPYYGCAMALRADQRALVLPFPSYLTESHDLWIATVANTARRMTHVPRPVVRRRLHEANASTSRPRGVAAALRSRQLLLRLWAEAARRVRSSRA